MTAAAGYVPIALVVLAFACGEPAAAGAFGVAARGQGDYATYCAPCHGSRGGGDGPLAQMLVPRPARHSDAAFMNALSDEYLFRLLKEGGPALGKSPLMGAWGKNLSEQRIRDLVAFLRTLAVRGERRESPREENGTARFSQGRGQSDVLNIAQ
jgi:cytochrome c oxidase cbb3-type subunit III